MMLKRTVVYYVEADDKDRAEEIWEEDGPEVADSRRITIMEETDFEEVRD